jgi:hypothetical protein
MLTFSLSMGLFKKVLGSGRFIDTTKKKTIFKKNPIQSIFLLTKKTGKKSGKYLKLAETAREA